MLADVRIAQIAQKRVYSLEKDDPQPHVDLAFGFLMVKPGAREGVDEIDLGVLQILEC